MLIRSDHAPLKKFIYSNTTNDQLTAWAQDLFAIMLHIEFEHLRGSQNILSDAITRIKRFSLYNKIVLASGHHDDDKESLPVHPLQEDLEIPIFDRDVTWQIDNIGRDTTNGYMLNSTWYEVDNRVSVETTKAPIVQLKLLTENLRKLQAADKQHSKIRDQLMQGQDHLTFMLDDREILYQKVRDDNKYFQAVLVPEKLGKHILFELHDCFGHPRINKLCNYMQKYYYWPGIKRYCGKHVQSCKACKAVNLKPHRLTDLSMPISRVPMETICMDLFGPLPETNLGNNFALTAICLLTNYMLMIPIPTSDPCILDTYICPIWR